MVRRTITIGFAALMILNVLVVVNMISVPNVRGETGAPVDDGTGLDAVSGDNIWTTPGDWTIGFFESISHADKTIIVNGDLIIEEAATLTLTGVTLQMNSSFDGEFGIYVQASNNPVSGGILTIEESASNPSIITSYTEDGAHRFRFIVEGSLTDSRQAHLYMTNSELRQCGWDESEFDYQDAGLWLGSKDNIIDGNYIHDNYNGINIYGANAGPNTIQNNNISFNEQNGTYIRLAPSITIDNNEYVRNHQAIYFNTSQNAVVTNNYINNPDTYGAILDSVQGVTFNDNTIENLFSFLGYVHSAAAFGDFSSNIEAHRNTFHNCGFHALFAFSYTGYVLFTNNTFDDFENGAAYAAILGDNAYFYDNEAGSALIAPSGFSDSVGILAENMVGDVEIVNNHMFNMPQYQYVNRGAGIHLWDVSSAIIRNNEVRDTEFSGIYIIDSRNLTIENNVLENNLNYGISMVEDSVTPGGGAQNVLINNNIINGSEFGITGDVGSGIDITNNQLDGLVDTGIWTGVDGTYIAFNTIINTGTGTATGEGGIGIVGNTGSDPLVNDVWIYQNDITNGRGLPNPVVGIYLRDADNILIEECTIDSNNIGLETYGTVDNTLVENSTITPLIGTDMSFQLANDSYVTTLNTNFDNSSLNVDPSSNLTAKWYLDVQVKQGVSGVNGAEVYIEDILGGDDPPTGQPFVTKNIGGQNGWVKWIPLIEFVDEGGTRVDHTNHWVNVTSGALEGLARPKMWESQSIEIQLNSVPTIVDMVLSANSVYRTSTAYIFLNGTDVEDGEGLFTAEFQYRDPNDFSWNTTYFNTPLYYDPNTNLNDDIGFFYVPFTPVIDALTGWYDIRGRVRDTYGSYSAWEELIGINIGIDVRNNLPDVTTMYNETNSAGAPAGAVYRGDYSWIYGDGQDVEDGDDEFLAVQFEWSNNGGSTWEGSFYWTQGPEIASNNWREKFEPPKSKDTPTGKYLFRVRYQDLDNDWGAWEQLESLEVLNFPPWLIGFSLQNPTVLRENTVRIYADVDDREENEIDLLVKFYYDAPGGTTTWEDQWLSDNGQYDSISYYADFTPPGSAPLGDYKFMVEITDHETGSTPGASVQEVVGDTITVENNNPISVNLKVSSDTVRAGVGDKVYIHVNATDGQETLEEFLSIESIEWRRNDLGGSYESSGGFDRNLNEGYNSGGGGWLKGSLTPLSTAAKVAYDIRARVKDPDNGLSDWVELLNAFTVINPTPTIEDVTLDETEVLRGDTVYIILNANDMSQSEDKLKVEFRYKLRGTIQWTEMVAPSSDYNNADQRWDISFTPGIDWDDDDLGEYEFQVMVSNQVASTEWTDVTTPSPAYITVMNNKPEALELGLDGDSPIERGSTVTIYAKGDDREKDQDELTVTFEYSKDGSSWTTLSNPDFSNGRQRWEVEFTPDGDFELGNYHFQVIFNDGEDTSGYLNEQNLVEVINSVPVVTSLMVSSTSAYRMEAVTLTAMVKDADQDTSTLIPNFQFMGPNDANWISQSGSTYFENAFEVTPGQWQITFKAPYGADIGQYKFAVEFTDSAGDSSEPLYESTQTLTLKNYDPEVEITAPSSGTQSGTKISFEASGTDEEGDNDLKYEWDFGDGDGDNVENPTHDYSEPGTYEVKVTVTDNDGAEATDSITIIIEGEAGGFDMMTLMLLLIPIIVAVLLLVFLMTRKKKKPDEVPPAMAPAAAPPLAGPPMAAAPPPAAPVAAPPPPPAPMAAPAAAAAPAGGQKIKCPKCGTPFTVTETQRPITIECPNCGAKGKLN